MSKIMIIIYLVLITIFTTMSNAVVCNNLPNLQIKLIKDFNKNYQDYIDYSDCLLSLNKIDKNFTLSIKLINTMIKKYGEDSIHVQIAYLLLGRHYLFINRTQVADELLSFVEETKENERYEKKPHLNQVLLYLKGRVHEDNKAYEKAIQLYQKALILNKNIKDEYNLSKLKILNRLADTFIEFSKPNEALTYISQATQLELKLKQNRGKDATIDTIMIYAKLYENNKNYVKAASILYDEIETHLKDKDKDLYFPKMLELLTQYSWNTLRLQQYTPTIFSAKLSLDIQNKLNINNSPFAVANYFCMGFSEKYLKHNNKAKEYLKKSLNILTKIKMNNEEKNNYIKNINTLLLELDK